MAKMVFNISILVSQESAHILNFAQKLLTGVKEMFLPNKLSYVLI